MIWRRLSFALIKSDEMTFVSFNLSLKEKHKRKEEEEEEEGGVERKRWKSGWKKNRGRKSKRQRRIRGRCG